MSIFALLYGHLKKPQELPSYGTQNTCPYLWIYRYIENHKDKENIYLGNKDKITISANKRLLNESIFMLHRNKKNAKINIIKERKYEATKSIKKR